MTSVLNKGPEWGVQGRYGMVATGHPRAAQAATRVLRAGGNAVDAAIAADAVLGVVEPMATGIGGDLLCMVVPPGAEVMSYNGTGCAPVNLALEVVEKLPNARIPERHPLSVTVPGVVRGWHDLHQRYGQFPWQDLFTDAIEIARGGFAVAPIAAREWKLFERVLQSDVTSAHLYWAGGVPQAGDIFTNPELAALLSLIAKDGPDAFYRGPAATAAGRTVQEKGGVLDARDFALHRGFFAAPVSERFRGLTVHECPPNTHGVAVLHALKALEPLDLDPSNPQTTVAMVEHMREALQRARETVADPAGNTVCTVIVDAKGFAITLMSSIFKRFGSGISVPGFGFVLQNRGFGFSQPGHINGPAPAKRPYHTVVPAAVTREGCFFAGLGVVGGAMQAQGHVQLLTRLAAWQQPLQAAIDGPRWRLEGGRSLALEEGTPDEVATALRRAGFLEPKGLGELGGRSDFGGAQVVLRDADGLLIGGSDKRKDGMALAV